MPTEAMHAGEQDYAGRARRAGRDVDQRGQVLRGGGPRGDGPPPAAGLFTQRLVTRKHYDLATAKRRALQRTGLAGAAPE
ncbi:MAG TPA: hypothetical protein VH008_18965 [Pseudonocardia sp.]|jgi:hypothetical protein|nr:hypothetical protein [Pseudonocardia sp.]